ncbi:hypothetical protein B0I35DRAFT_494478 [Stachybotrys elegans]|uniref:Uncharacterized protein n=1 Tax=Stachybotrys elegans TaxID=80388 RepID=A0A8K0SFP4_9HYPO|nr:hypothetical protein B0I35DRAFT_494478 [Stachybotrys elegans]
MASNVGMLWLDDMSLRHLQEFHQMRTDKEAARLSDDTVSESMEESKARLEAHIAELNDSWTDSYVMKKAIVVDRGNSGFKTVGFIYTTGPTPQGLGLRFEMLSQWRRHFYCTQGLLKFFEMYHDTFTQRRAPVEKAFDIEDDIWHARAAGDDGKVPVQHLVCSIPMENKGAYAVAWKLKGVPRLSERSGHYIFYFERKIDDPEEKTWAEMAPEILKNLRRTK